MRIAVLMSTYNGERYIKDQIDSILAQHGNFNLDLWVRDDGSTDKTIEILQHYSSNGKLKWYTGDNLGPAKSFLDIVKHCGNYDFYSFADQDDIWLEDKLFNAIETIKNNDMPMVYFSNAYLSDEDLNYSGKVVYKKTPKTDFNTLSCAGGILGCTIVFNMQMAKLIQKADNAVNIIMHDFWIALICSVFDGQIIFDHQPQMVYRQHNNNVVGVAFEIKKIILGRIRDIITRPPVSIADQAMEIIRIYGQDICSEKKEWLTKVGLYRSSFFTRLSLATSGKTKYINYNMGAKLRLSILMGNR